MAMGPPQLIGRYQLREELGAGGFATVFRAYDPALDREVALKVLHSHLASNPEVAERFVREGRALARVRHPNVVQVFDTGAGDDAPYLAMELIEGRPLSELLIGRGPIPVAQVVAVAEQIAAALAAIHARGLVHRDIKPPNILIEADTGRAVLLDLGVARMLDGGVTATGWLVGTPAYMAPEQIEPDMPITPQTDVYQLGATVYALLAGRPPFEGAPTRVMQAVLRQPPADLSALRPDLPPAVFGVIMEALAKDPARRPQGARAFAAQLRAAARMTLTQETPPWLSPPLPRDGAAVWPAADTAAPTPPAAGRATHPSPAPGRPPAATLTPLAGAAPAWTAAPPANAPRRVPVAVVAVVVAAVIFVGGIGAAMPLLRDDGGPPAAGDAMPVVAPPAVAEPTASPSPPAATATPTPTPVPAPVVTGLQIGPQLTAMGQSEFEATDTLFSCFGLTTMGDGTPLTTVLTPGTTLPRDQFDPAVVARSEADRPSAGVNCQQVAVLQPPLAPGDYTVSIMLGTAVLAQQNLRTLAPAPPLTPAPPVQPPPVVESPAPATAVPTVRPPVVAPPRQPTTVQPPPVQQSTVAPPPPVPQPTAAPPAPTPVPIRATPPVVVPGGSPAPTPRPPPTTGGGA